MKKFAVILCLFAFVGCSSKKGECIKTVVLSIDNIAEPNLSDLQCGEKAFAEVGIVRVSDSFKVYLNEKHRVSREMPDGKKPFVLIYKTNAGEYYVAVYGVNKLAVVQVLEYNKRLQKHLVPVATIVFKDDVDLAKDVAVFTCK